MNRANAHDKPMKDKALQKPGNRLPILNDGESFFHPLRSFFCIIESPSVHWVQMVFLSGSYFEVGVLKLSFEAKRLYH
jgi:hypothetical protein